MAIRIYYWIHHTGQYDGNSGVQRVVRCLAAKLSDEPNVILIPVRWCSQSEAIVHAEDTWLTMLGRYSGPILDVSPLAGTPLHLTGELKVRGEDWLLMPEVPHSGGGAIAGPPLALPIDYARFYGLRMAAIFYDLIPIRFEQYAEIRPAHEAYASALYSLDCIMPISRTASDDLLAWWTEQGFAPAFAPTLQPLLLPSEMLGTARVQSHRANQTSRGTRFAMLGTVEPRKNQVSAMRAFNRVVARHPGDSAITLDIVGHLHPFVAQDFHRTIENSEGRIRYHEYLSDEALRALLLASTATIFVSLMEGYGLPISESLWLGVPVIASEIGSMREIAKDGGCILVDPTDEVAIERAIETLISEPDLLASLTHDARTRPLPIWSRYTQDVLRVLTTVPPMPAVVVISGSRGDRSDRAKTYEGCGVRVHNLTWSRATRAILPRPENRYVPGELAFGELQGLWAIVPYASVASAAEAMAIEDEARGLGMRVALLCDETFLVKATTVHALATVDLAVLMSEMHRADAISAAFRYLPRTTTLRQRTIAASDDAHRQLTVIAHHRAGLARQRRGEVPKRIYYWAGMTATQSFNSGVQRVTRQVAASLQRHGIEVIPVKWDQARESITILSEEEGICLAMFDGPTWIGNHELPSSLVGEWLLIPEIVVPAVPFGSNPARFAKGIGMKVSMICHDLIPWKMPDLYNDHIRDAFQNYWQAFSECDVVTTVSWSVAADLRRYLASIGLNASRIVPCPNAGELPGSKRQLQERLPRPAGTPLRLLAIGTLEPRKNYVLLLEALAALKRGSSKREVTLTIVGRRAGFAALESRLESLADETGTVLHGDVTDAELLTLIDGSDATVFASTEEGFGLPVLESLWRGLPCMCHVGSALAEIAPGGGVLTVDMKDVDAIVNGLRQLCEDDALIAELVTGAVNRPVRTWDETAADILSAIAAANVAPGWPMPAIISASNRFTLTCAITTYNRANWLKHSLPRLLDVTRPFGNSVQVVVCDNTSTDETPEIVSQHAGAANFKSVRNSQNVGMLGNLGATARVSDGRFVWLLGDDDIVLDGVIKSILDGIERHPDIEMVYMNYLYTLMKDPASSVTMNTLLDSAKPIGYGGQSRYVRTLKEVSAYNENLFTAIYACAFRRDHALRAYQIDTRGTPFSSMETCIPSSVYALLTMQERPAYWIGEPGVLINMNVSWLRWALIWHLERMPDLFDAAELAGIDPGRVDMHRVKHCANAGEWTHAALFLAEDAIRTNFSVARLIERCKHLPEFQSELKKVYSAYADAYKAGRLGPDDRLTPDDLFASFGLRT